MSGHATHPEPIVRSDDGNVRVSAAEQTPITILDARVPRPDGYEALLRLEHQSGPAVAAIREQGAAFRIELLGELHALAGGQAPPSVMALAELATGALISLHMQRYMTMGSFGVWAESDLDASANRLRESAEKSQRNLAGLAVVARDLLQSARAAAREASGAAGASPTQQLLTRIGASHPVPPQAPGVGVIGAPPFSNHSSPIPNSGESE